MNRILRATVLVATGVVVTGCFGGNASTTATPSTASSPLAGGVAAASPIGDPASLPSTGPSSSPASSQATASPNEPTSAPASTARPTARPTATPDDEGPYPEPTQTPQPRVVLGLGGRSINSTYVRLEESRAYETDLQVRTKHLDQRDCRLTHVTMPDKPGVKASNETLSPVDVQRISFIDGRHEIRVACPSTKGTLRDRMVVIATDGQPERCKGFDFPKADISVSTIDELTSGMVGTWHGCVTTPWTIQYGVDVTFRADGTYSATSGEVLDGQTMTALYYGIDDDSPLKKWWINDLQASNKGVGEIDIVFDAKGVNRDELRNVKLMGDQLELELFHQGQYGPVLVQLFRD